MLITTLRIIVNVLSTIEVQMTAIGFDIRTLAPAHVNQFLVAKKALRDAISLFVQLTDDIADSQRS